MIQQRLFFMAMALMISVTTSAQKVTTVWSLGDADNLGATVVTGAEQYAALVTNAFALGSKLTAMGAMTASSADTDNGYTAVNYTPAFQNFQAATKVDNITDGNGLTFQLTVGSGHTLKPTNLKFDAVRCGTNGGSIAITLQKGSGTVETFKEGLQPLRNKIMSGNDIGFSSFNYALNDILIEGGTFTVTIYFMGLNGSDTTSPKQMGFRNVTIESIVDEPVYDLSHYISAFTCTSSTGEALDLFSAVKGLGNAETGMYGTKLYGQPTNFNVTANEGYTASVAYADNTATITVKEGDEVVYTSMLHFTVSNRTPHAKATPLNRGLLAIHLSSGNLVSWRMRATDDPGKTQYKLYRDGQLIQTLTMKTNYLDKSATAAATYRIDICDASGNVFETQTATTWAGQYLAIPLAKSPTDTNGTGATYTPNDATCYDMDGDGEQEIVFKWEPSNVKDAASSGNTGAVWLECVKLDGTQLWRINLGKNIWASQHTVSFLCYDFDGDGYGELICKTAPGTIDGEGNYVVMAGDDPQASYVGSNGKILGGPEYVTVFDGVTGGEISTISSWPAYRDGKNYGDTKDNRAFRFNTTLARLDVGGKATPCAVMNRGYYDQAYYQAVTFDGAELKEVWRKGYETSGQGAYGQGYHTLQSADVDNDGFDEIVVGSAMLDHDGTCMWRSGEGHGDACHIGDFNWDNEGMEVYTVKEEYKSSNVHYAQEMRDARTGKLIWGTDKAAADCGRGLCGDFDSAHEGAESMCSAYAGLYDAKGNYICDWHVGTTSSSSINFRIYWDGDLYDEYHDRQHVDKWSATSKSWGRLQTLWSIGPGASTINGTKYVPNLQADILGDWREEVVYWYTVDADNGLYGLNIISTNYTSDYMLPYLRDDHVYDNAIAWQNTTYNQPPHLSYSPILYWEELQKKIADGIVDIKTSSADNQDATYNLAGQRIANGAKMKGIVIRGGKKVVSSNISE